MKSVTSLDLKFLHSFPMVRRLARRNSSSTSSGTLNDCFSSAYKESRSACPTSDQSGCVIATRARAIAPHVVLHFFRVISGSGTPVTASTPSTSQVPWGLTEGFLARRWDLTEDVVGVGDPGGDKGGDGGVGSIYK